ncbi:hypothetical protein [Burkholderia cenocepacia]|uniref:hypothetical protein n=1 Tax=Burkholderia cenocepacia TaxID=95486 RepID=UPI0015895C75|nr:hypothetical protein [Burkholderia cenocepacia]MCA8087711.1 hypothetical protein [Burkholderia cenocepacia]
MTDETTAPGEDSAFLTRQLIDFQGSDARPEGRRVSYHRRMLARVLLPARAASRDRTSSAAVQRAALPIR